jgi:glucose-6-phosphate 1-dehydrogenase
MSTTTANVAEAPKSDAYYCEMPNAPCTIVMFGASGDLAKRKLLPALFDLAVHACLAPRFRLLGFARTEMTNENFRASIAEGLPKKGGPGADENRRQDFLKQLDYFNGNYDDPESFRKLAQRLEQLDSEGDLGGNRLFYLATPPDVYPHVIDQLGRAGLARAKGKDSWTRIIIEKPFGHDGGSARDLNAKALSVFEESQIYRIDHYLGKETVQNILVFRFSNGIFEPIWNRRYIDHIQITVAETVGVEQRGMYYDKAGTLRDMVPNHIFQLISLTAMEPPVSFDADVVRDEQAKILKALTPMTDEEVLTRTVRGQYGEGLVKGSKILPYRSEPMVAPDSRTETFVAMKLFIDNWRWADVPFYLRTGKALPKRATEISIQFKRAPFVLFRKTAVDRLEPNRLVLHLQPDEGISLSFGAKIPGPVVQIGGVDMNFNYTDYFNATPQTGYERLLYDCMLGDATLFQRSDMVETAWHVVAPILDVWEALPPRRFPNYAAGTWGPPEAEEMLTKDRRHWSSCE